LETLSIIAYSQPLTRGEIESLRGVSVGGVIKLLVEQELIREVGRKDGPGASSAVRNNPGIFEDFSPQEYRRSAKIG
jgi:chromosome segregation and condensation protein ScpB